jgi:uncharacterized hydrophobic protein (TIGR00271 family)
MSFRERFINFIKIASGNKKLSEIYSEQVSGKQETGETPEAPGEASAKNIQRAKEKLKKMRKPVENGHNGEETEKKDEPSQLDEKIEDIKEMFDHVIRPEERNWKNYLSPSFWLEKSDTYSRIREKEREDMDVYNLLSQGAIPSVEYYVLTVLSCILSTIGLILGATAVIIGAMIVAPLMTPILAFSLGVIWGDIALIRISVQSILKGVFWGIVISAVIAYLIPLPTLSEEIIMRTHPTLFDVLVALASGIVGAYGYANKRISNTLIGIAIAVALMPPLCTIGIGIGIRSYSVVSGAALLFFINLVSISLAGAVVFWTMKIHPVLADQGLVAKRAIWQILISLAILVGISAPVGIFMYSEYLVTQAERDIREKIIDEFKDHSLFRISRLKREDESSLDVILTGESPPDSEQSVMLKKELLKIHPEIREIRISFIKSIPVGSK